MKEQFKMVNIPRQVERTNLELCEPEENDTTQELSHIFVWKDIWKKLEVSQKSQQIEDASIQPQTPSNESDIGSVSTGIFALSMSSHSWWSDTDGPLMVPSSADGMGHNLPQGHTQPSGGLLLQCATWEEEPIGSPIMEFRMEASTRADPDKITEGVLRHLQYTKGWPGTRSHKPWRMGENNSELPNKDHSRYRDKWACE